MNANPENSSSQPSADTRAELQRWYQASNLTDLKFWMVPNKVSGLEECEAEFNASIKRIAKARADKTLQVLKAEDVRL